MGDVYFAPSKHRCRTPERWSRRLGSVWLCDDCGTYWTLRHTKDLWGRMWTPVRWWHFEARRRIKGSRHGC
jgi:hypothetical protein